MDEIEIIQISGKSNIKNLISYLISNQNRFNVKFDVYVFLDLDVELNEIVDFQTQLYNTLVPDYVEKIYIREQYDKQDLERLKIKDIGDINTVEELKIFKPISYERFLLKYRVQPNISRKIEERMVISNYELQDKNN